MPTVRCPQCAAPYRVPAGRTGGRLRCRRCGATFAAGSAARGRSRRAARRGLPGWLLGPLLAVAAAGVAWGLWSAFQNTVGIGDTAATSQPPAAAAKPEAPAPARPEAARHPALDTIRFLARAASSSNLAVVGRQLDSPSWYEAAAGPDAPRWTALPSARKREYEDGLGRQVAADAALLALDDASLASARYVEGAPEAEDLVALGFDHPLQPGATLVFECRRRGGVWRVAGIRTEAAPVPEEPEEDEGTLGADYVALDEGAAAGQAEAAGDGGPARTYRGTIARVELVPGTTAEEARHIESLIDQALAGSGPGARAAERELIEIGHHAVPPLLNRLVALPLTDAEDRVLTLAALDGLLRKVSYRREATRFPVPGLSNLEDPDRLRQRRQIVLEAWFGWWAKWGEHWEAWSKEAEIPPPDPRRRRRR